MDEHKSDFRLYAAGKTNKMDNKLLFDRLISHCIDFFHVCIVNMINVDNNTESQLEELLGRKERNWIWDLDSIIPMDYARMMHLTVKTKGVEMANSVPGLFDYSFSYFQ